MMDMSKILEQISLNPEQEKKITSENARKYARLRSLEKQIQKEIALLMGNLSEEEVKAVDETFNEDPFEDVPQYLSVAEVAMITGLSPQMVRRNCANGVFDGYQPSGNNGKWFINSDTFRKDSKKWKEFVERRNELFSKSAKAAKASINLLNDNPVEKEID